MWMQHNMSLASVLTLRDIFRGASEYDLKTYPPQLVRSIVLQVFQKKKTIRWRERVNQYVSLCKRIPGPKTRQPEQRHNTCILTIPLCHAAQALDDTKFKMISHAYKAGTVSLAMILESKPIILWDPHSNILNETCPSQALCEILGGWGGSGCKPCASTYALFDFERQ